MATERHEDVDVRLREVFATDQVAASRVAHRALTNSQRRPGGRSTWLRVRHLWPRTRPVRASLALGAIAMCAVLAAWQLRPAVVQAPETRQPVIQLSGSFIDGVLVVPFPDDSVVIASAERRDRPRDGSGIVVVEGDVK